MSHRLHFLLTAGLGWVLAVSFVAQTQADEAAPKALIQVELEGEGPFWVGQQIALSVTLKAPGYFDSAVSFQLPDPSGVLLIPPSEHPVVGNETIDDTMYVTQQYDLGVWPMRPGTQEVPALTLRFNYKSSPLDENSIPASVTSKPLQLRVTSPPGTENLGIVISAHHLQVQESWKPELSAEPVIAGTAFTRTLQFSAANIPGMVFPPFPVAQVDGLGVYSQQQVLDQNQDRDSMIGIRRDVITYIAKRPGQYTIPAVQFSWFDLDNNQLRTQTFAAHTLNVVPNPEMAATSGGSVAANDITANRKSRQRQWWVYFAGLVPVLLLGLNRSVRQWLLRTLIQPLRPVHLKPLYPSK